QRLISRPPASKWATRGRPRSFASHRAASGHSMRTTSSPVMEMSMAWLVLFVAGLFEIGWAVGLKYTEGFTRLWPTVWTAASMLISLWLLGLALRSLPLGTAYAVWTGIGTTGTALLGIVLFSEPAEAMRLVCIGLIVAGIIGLKLVTPQ